MRSSKNFICYSVSFSLQNYEKKMGRNKYFSLLKVANYISKLKAICHQPWFSPLCLLSPNLGSTPIRLYYVFSL